MSRADWAFTLPKEMRSSVYDEDDWGCESHISLDSDEAFMLGFEVPWKMPREEVSPFPPPASPPLAPAPSPCHTPMMNHHTTFYQTSPCDMPANHAAPTPGSPIEATPHTLPPRALDDQQFDRWINSQSSIVEHPRPADNTYRPSGFKGRILSFSNPSESSTPVPPLEPDSAGTIFSSSGPGTPPPPPAFRDINHYNGNPFALVDPVDLPLSPSAYPDKVFNAVQEINTGSDMMSITRIVNAPTPAIQPCPTSASTFYVEVEDPSPRLDTRSKRKDKRQRKSYNPASSSPRPTKPHKRAKKTPAPVQPPLDIFNVHPADTTIPDADGLMTSQMECAWAGEGHHRIAYGYVPGSPGPMPGAAIATDISSADKEGGEDLQRESLDVLASAAARRRQTASPVHVIQGVDESRAMKNIGVLDGDVEGGMDVDDKSWLLDQMNGTPSRSPISFNFPTESTPPPTFALPDRTNPDQDDHQPTIPSSAIPGSKLLSPAKSSTSDETTDSETTPTLDSRTKRRNERELRRLRRIGIMTDDKVDPEDEFSPGPAVRGRSETCRRNGLEGIDSAVSELKGDAEDDDVRRGLLSFGSDKGKHLKLKTGSMASEKTGILSRFSTAATEESFFGTTSPSAKEAMERAQAKKTLPGSSIQPVRKKNNFVAPKPIAKTESQVSLPSANLDTENMNKNKGKKRKLDVLENVEDEQHLPEIKKTKVTFVQARLPLAPVSASTDNKYTSISESTKLRRARTAGPALTPIPADPASSTAIHEAGIPASSKGKKKSTRVNLASKRSSTNAGPVQPIARLRKDADGEDDDADYGKKGTKSKSKKGTGTNKKRLDEEEEEEEEAGQKTSKSYSEAEISIILDSWDGRSTLSFTALNQCVEELVNAGYKLRTPTAIKWYMKNTLWPRFSAKYGLPLVRAGSGQGKGGRSKS